MRRFSLFVMVALVAALAAATLSQAAVYMKQVTHTDAIQMMGQVQPEKLDTAVMWYSGRATTAQSPLPGSRSSSTIAVAIAASLHSEAVKDNIYEKRGLIWL